MKIQFTESVGGFDFNFGRGGKYTLSKSDAEYWIREGYAKEVEEEKPKEKRPLKPKRKAKTVKTRPVNKKE